MAAKKSRNKSRPMWLERHLSDIYVKKAQQDKYRSRAAYKLLQIDDSDHILRPGQLVVDLGSAPGAWSQVLARRLKTGRGGRVVALDILPMDPVEQVEFIQGDFREAEAFEQLQALVGDRRVDLVLSDMAPNLSGVAAADSARMQHLVELAVEFAKLHLHEDGALLVKCFHGSGFSQIVELFKSSFVRVKERKPDSSRAESAETFVLGQRLKPGVGAAWDD